MGEEILITKKERDKLRFIVKKRLGHSANSYQNVLNNRDFKMLAYLLYDLNCMGYPIEKAYTEFKRLLEEPSLFFLK